MFKLFKDGLTPLCRRSSLAIAALCALLAAATGPFGTYDSQTFLLRLLYWGLVTFSSILLGTLSHHAAQHFLGRDRPLLVDLGATVSMVLLFTPVLYGLTHGLLLYDTATGPTLFRLSYYVAGITMVICVLRRVLPGGDEVGYFDTAGNLTTDRVAERPRLMRRLPEDFGGPILRLAVRDHFVDVVSARETVTLRMRFADAVGEMEPVPGFSTHRSHWVAQAAIVGVRREGGKTLLELSNGDLVPVSRTYRPDLETAGFL